MTTSRVPRFSAAEIAYHWAQAIPYLVLFLTGAALLARRLLELGPPGHRTLSVVHTIAGLALIAALAQTLVIIVVRNRSRFLWRTLRDACSWHPRDLVWLVKAPLHAVVPSVRLPHVGRFNPGQKLHLLVIMLLVAGFIVSGLAMMVFCGALAPWVVHMALFVPACGLIGVHLFLALVNPPTRRALSGMFLGHVSADYAKAHHRLWAGEPDRPDEHQALISRPVLSAVLVVLVLGAVGLGWLYGPERLGSRVTAVWQSRGRLLLMPGDLCASHARDPGNDKCGACHVMWGRTPSALCLECHRRIEQVQAGRLGYHGRLAGECRDCHGDHKGVAADVRNLDQSAFNHNRANYPLEGRHRELSCEACHLVGKEPGPEQQRYIGLQFGACVDCHTNPHTDPAALNCARCHIVQGWRRPLVLFDHNRDSRFLLEGQHALTPCDRCHRRPSPLLPSAPFELYNVGRTCADCHKDVHEGTLGRDCQHCHTAAAWGGRELVFNHNHDSKYVLAGRHGAVDCAKCHRPPEGQSLGMAKFTGLETRCAACHQDPHGGQFKKSCEECHGVEGWKGPQLKFIHNRDSDYVLDAVHGGLSCASCHRGQPAVVYRPVARNCAGCHGHANMAVEGRLGGGSAQPDPHAGRVSCEKCHDMSKRRPGLADYAKACGQCHGPRYEDLLYDWARALHDRQASAERLLAEVRRKGSADADSMARKIQEAKVVGLHNFQQARKMWDDILGPASSKGQDP